MSKVFDNSLLKQEIDKKFELLFKDLNLEITDTNVELFVLESLNVAMNTYYTSSGEKYHESLLAFRNDLERLYCEVCEIKS